MNIKSLFINHCDKLTGILIAMLGLWGIAGTSWDHATTLPAALTLNAYDVRDEIARHSEWPESERKKFQINVDIRALAAELVQRGDLDFEQFSMDVAWHPTLIPVQEKKRSVAVLPPRFPEVTPVSVPIAFPPDETESDETDDEDPDSPDPEDDEEELSEEQKRARERFGSAEEAGSRINPNSNTTVDSLLKSGLTLFGRSRQERMAGQINNQQDRKIRQLRADARRKVRWRGGISVRMLVDLRAQRQKIAEALHIRSSSYTEAQAHIDYQSIRIQRQELRLGRWTEWEDLRLEDLVEILDESLGTDVDTVLPTVTRPTITMPLPRRAAASWLPGEVSHSRLEDFELDADERDMLNRIVASIYQEALEAEREQKATIRRKEGFGAYIEDASELRQAARSKHESDEELKNSIRKIVEDTFDQEQGFTEEQKRIFDDVLAQLSNAEITAADRLLLVRFIDFTAERGVTYRYRVRLEMFNPNYQQPPDLLEDPEQAEQETIVSPWSEPTPPATVPVRYRNHLKEVAGKSDGIQPLRVKTAIFYQDDGILPVVGTIDVEVGMPIGGVRKIERVDLEKTIVETGDVVFETDELLGGVIVRPDFDRTTLPEEFAQDVQQLRRSERVIPDLACVIDFQGDVQLREVSSTSPDLKNDEELAAWILRNYEDWKRDAKKAVGSAETGRGSRATGMNYGNVLTRTSRGRRQRNR